MPIKYQPLTPAIPKEFVIPSAEDYFIWWLFRDLCVECRKPASEINEIVPRSRSKNSVLDWRNRVTMCREHHNNYHRHGVNSTSIAKLQETRITFLKEMGREEYVTWLSEEESLTAESSLILG